LASKAPPTIRPVTARLKTGQRQNSDWETVYDAYISGPLIKDKLFFYLTAEWQHDSNHFGTVLKTTVSTSPAGYWNSSSTSSPKLYGKLDWNITDSNVLELTGVKSDSNETSNNYYNYNYSNQSVANYYAPGVLTKKTSTSASSSTPPTSPTTSRSKCCTADERQLLRHVAWRQ
jgi:hypothetical protein